jgi:hypothetical protein
MIHIEFKNDGKRRLHPEEIREIGLTHLSLLLSHPFRVHCSFLS